MSVNSDLASLGLLKVCTMVVEMWDDAGRYEVECGAPVLRFGGLCAKHNGSIEMAAEVKLIKVRSALAEKQRLENEILPKSTARVIQILDDPDAKAQDIIKIWMTTMDRIGLAAVQGLIVEDVTDRTAPLDILKDLLAGRSTTDRVTRVIDADPDELDEA